MKPILVLGLFVLGLGFLPAPVRADPEPENLEKHIAQLENKYPRARLKAVATLGRKGSAAKDAVPALGKALHDLDEDVRTAAGRALAQIGPAAVPVLIEELKNPLFQYSKQAARSLALIGPEAADAVPALTRSLKVNDAEVRAMAAHALAEIGPAAAKAATALTLVLDDPSKEVKKQARAALARIGAQAIPALRGALKSSNPSIRQQAADLLALRGTEAKEALADLVSLLADKNSAVRRSAALAVGAMGQAAQQASEPLKAVLTGPDPKVRAAAAWALGEVSSSAGLAVNTLVALFRDPVAEVRFQAAMSVVKLGPASVNVLVDAIPKQNLANENLATRLYALLAVGEIGPEARDAVPILVEQLRDSLPMIRSGAATALGKIGPEAARKAIEPLKDALIGELAGPVRVSIRLALAQLLPEDPRALQELNREIIGNNQEIFQKALEKSVRPRTPLEIQRQMRIKGVLNFYVYRNSFRFGDGLDKWSHAVLESLGVEAIPSMVDALNQENFAGGKEGYVVRGIPVDKQPPPGPVSVFFK